MNHVSRHNLRRLQGVQKESLSTETIITIVAVAVGVGLILLIGIVAGRLIFKHLAEKKKKEMAIQKAREEEGRRQSKRVNNGQISRHDDILKSLQIRVQEEDSQEFHPDNTPADRSRLDPNNLSMGGEYNRPFSARETAEKKFSEF